MEVTPRTKQILQVLLQETEPISVQDLAEQIGVSKRTTQRELEYMDSSLRDYQIKFRSKTGVGVWLEGSADEKEHLREELQGKEDYDASNREERRKRLILEILKEKGLKKLFYYSSQFGVSEATVRADLEAVEGWLKEHNLAVSRKPGSGISIVGSEESYRRAIRDFIRENMDTKVVWDAYENTDHHAVKYENLKKSNIGEILNEDIMKRVMDCLENLGNSRMMTLTESSYVGLIIHISIAVNRIMKNEVIEEDERALLEVTEDEDYELAKRIANELEEEFSIEIPTVERIYIWLHMKGSKHEKIAFDASVNSQVENREMQKLVNEMIDAFDREHAYLLKQDDEFIQGLLAHLQPTIVRLAHGMQIQNPVLEDIQKSYPDIYRGCEKVAEILEKNTGKNVPAEEIGFLTVHFGAAMVRMQGRKEKLRHVHAGVVCSSGIGISRLMSSKLEHLFGERLLLTTYGKNDVTPYVAAKTDFFVSTVPLELNETPIIFVNPLLSESDVEKIRHLVFQYERLPEKQKEEDSFSVQLEEINLIATQIKTILKYMGFFKVDSQISFEELLIAIAEQMSPYSDHRELIREDLWKREQVSSQIFAEFGFALLHTRTKGVVRPAFNVCVTKDLKAFADPYFKGISVVIIMLVPCDENLSVNNDIMGYISSMLIEDYDFLTILSRGEKEEIRETLSSHLKKYFNKYLAGI